MANIYLFCPEICLNEPNKVCSTGSSVMFVTVAIFHRYANAGALIWIPSNTESNAMFDIGHLKPVETGWVVFDDEDVVLDGEKISVAGEQSGKVESFLEIGFKYQKLNIKYWIFLPFYYFAFIANAHQVGWPVCPLCGVLLGARPQGPTLRWKWVLGPKSVESQKKSAETQ